MENQFAEIQESAASTQVKEEQTADDKEKHMAEVKAEQEAGVGSACKPARTVITYAIQ